MHKSELRIKTLTLSKAHRIQSANTIGFTPKSTPHIRAIKKKNATMVKKINSQPQYLHLEKKNLEQKRYSETTKPVGSLKQKTEVGNPMKTMPLDSCYGKFPQRHSPIKINNPGRFSNSMRTSVSPDHNSLTTRTIT